MTRVIVSPKWARDIVEVDVVPGERKGTYDVTLPNGVVITVEKTERNWSRKPAGRRYATAQGVTTAWRVRGAGWQTFDTRAQAIYAAWEKEQRK